MTDTRTALMGILLGWLTAMLVLLLLTIGSAHASWTMDYTTRSDVSTLHTFYGAGSYEFLKTPDYVVVYRFDEGHMTYLGMLGQVELPAGLPPIVFPPGTDDLVASDPVDTGLFGGGGGGGGGGAIVATPEHAVLRRFARHLGGQQLARFVNPALQRMTASLAARFLRAPSSGHLIFLPTRALDVQQWCSGLTTMKWLMLLALVVSFVWRLDTASGAFLIVLAALVGLEANVLRVVGIGWGYQKDTAMWTAFSFGVVQVAIYALALVAPRWRTS